MCVRAYIHTHMYVYRKGMHLHVISSRERESVCVCGRAFKSMLHSMRTSSLIDRTSSYSHHELLIEWPWQHQLCW